MVPKRSDLQRCLPAPHPAASGPKFLPASKTKASLSPSALQASPRAAWFCTALSAHTCGARAGAGKLRSPPRQGLTANPQHKQEMQANSPQQKLDPSLPSNENQIHSSNNHSTVPRYPSQLQRSVIVVSVKLQPPPSPAFLGVSCSDLFPHLTFSFWKRQNHGKVSQVWLLRLKVKGERSLQCPWARSWCKSIANQCRQLQSCEAGS